MKKNRVTGQMLSIAAFILLLVGSCAKGDIVPLPGVGFLTIFNFAVGDITVIQGADSKFKLDRNVEEPQRLNTPGGKNQFRFYESNVLLLDTSIMVEPSFINEYVLFKPNQNAPLRIYDQTFNGFDKEIIPDSGYVKYSVANFSERFPGKVNIYITTTTIIDTRTQEIQVAEFLNTSGSFTEFKVAMLGTTVVKDIPEHNCKLIIKDPQSHAVLATANFTIPTGKGLGSKDMPFHVFLIYFSDNASAPAQILMRK